MAGNVPLEPPRIRLTLGNYGAACSDLSKSIVPAGGRVARMTRPSIYDALGGARALRALAADFHARCVADPVLEHPFSHTSNPEHVERLADFWGEVLGGPPPVVGGGVPAPPAALLRLVRRSFRDAEPARQPGRRSRPRAPVRRGVR